MAYKAYTAHNRHDGVRMGLLERLVFLECLRTWTESRAVMSGARLLLQVRWATVDHWLTYESVDATSSLTLA